LHVCIRNPEHYPEVIIPSPLKKEGNRRWDGRKRMTEKENERKEGWKLREMETRGRNGITNLLLQSTQHWTLAVEGIKVVLRPVYENLPIRPCTQWGLRKTSLCLADKKDDIHQYFNYYRSSL
jgi:hypothetical protein